MQSWIYMVLALFLVKESQLEPSYTPCMQSRTAIDPLVRYHQDCSIQVASKQLSEDGSCAIVKYDNNSTSCSDMSFPKHSENNVNLGTVNLRPFVWNFLNQGHYFYTVHNITFEDIKWTHMKFRFEATEDKDDKTIKVRKNHCREIVLNGSSTLDNFGISSLNYDCSWSDQDKRYEGQSFIFEYEAQNGDESSYGKLFFKVPSKELVESFPFYYVNITRPGSLDLYMLLNNNPTTKDFLVELCMENYQNTSGCCNEGKIFTLDMNRPTIYPFESDYNGWCFFRITPLDLKCKNGLCKSEVTPNILCVKPSIIYSILWNALWICLFAGVLFSLWRVLKRHQKFTPKVLVIHPNTNKSHTELIETLCEYLEEQFNWDIVWNKEIELSHHGDPYIWCLEAFMNANTVIYVEKPSYSNNLIALNDISGNIHMHLGDIFIKILKTNKRNKDIKYFNIMLDTHDPATILPEIKNFNTFYLPTEWRHFIQSVKRYSWMQKLCITIPDLRDSTYGNMLIKAFDRLPS